MSKKKILLVEDTKEVYQMVNQALSPEIEVIWCQNLEDGRNSIAQGGGFDLFLIDIELPDGSGLNLCSEIQSKEETRLTPVFFLTAKKELSEKVLGFSAGADDYIVKPFEPLELRARVQAQLRKTELIKTDTDILKWKEISINKARQEVLINEERIDLTNLEFRILLFLANKAFEVVPRENLLDEIWGKDVHVYARSVDTHVSKLRKKIVPYDEIITSVHGVGYKFEPTEI